jgi:hypothetical protein
MEISVNVSPTGGGALRADGGRVHHRGDQHDATVSGSIAAHVITSHD